MFYLFLGAVALALVLFGLARVGLLDDLYLLVRGWFVPPPPNIVGQLSRHRAAEVNFRQSWPAWLREIGSSPSYAPDPVPDALRSLQKYEEETLYEAAIGEIRDAYSQYRIPARWAQETVIAYREQYAAAARAKAAAVREVTRCAIERHSS